MTSRRADMRIVSRNLCKNLCGDDPVQSRSICIEMIHVLLDTFYISARTPNQCCSAKGLLWRQVVLQMLRIVALDPSPNTLSRVSLTLSWKCSSASVE